MNLTKLFLHLFRQLLILGNFDDFEIEVPQFLARDSLGINRGRDSL